MKGILIAGAALAALIGPPAFAADLAFKAPPPAAPMTYDWSGCYIGANFGYGWNSATINYVDDPNVRDPIQGLGAVLPRSYDTGGRGWLGGGQVGCNWQGGRWVIGLEGDFDGTDWSKSAAASSPVATGVLTGTAISPTTVLLLPNAAFANEQVSQRWLSTVRVRLGFVPTDRLYVFGTGGLAIGDISSSGGVTAGVTNPLGASVVWSGSTTVVKVGYSAGFGAEYALTDHWNIKGEYLYFDLGDVSHPLGLTANSFPGVTPFPTLGNATTHITGNLVRAGLNYKF
jgi:outer membrane immunogenic protein